MKRKGKPKLNKAERSKFMDNKRNKHPAYIYRKVGNNFEFIGITHSPITENTRNIKLTKNPNPEDKRPAYIRPTPSSDNENNFKSVKKGWRFGKKDKELVKSIIEENDKKKGKEK